MEDKYHFGYDFDAALSGTTDGYFNNSIPADIYSPPGKNSDKKFLEPLQEQMERFEHQDERIEGLEAMISKMQRTIKVKCSPCRYIKTRLTYRFFQKMARKLKKLETLYIEKAPKKREGIKHSPTSCNDAGVLRSHGETWDKDRCTECNCQV